jgi:hypothetical protein
VFLAIRVHARRLRHCRHSHCEETRSSLIHGVSHRRRSLHEARDLVRGVALTKSTYGLVHHFHTASSSPHENELGVTLQRLQRPG